MTQSGDDAGVDASVPVDFCAEQLAHTYVSLVSFENNRRDLAASPNPMSSAVNPSYVSFDLTGSMLECPAPTNRAICDDPDAESVVVTADSGVSSINCTTGYNAVGENAPDGHCLVDGGTSRTAVHLVAKDLTDWGMNIGVELRQNCNNSTDPDASMYPGYPCYVNAAAEGFKGVSVWARLGSDDPSLAQTALVQIGDPATSSELGGTYPFNTPRLCGDAPCVMGVGPPPKSPCSAIPSARESLSVRRGSST